MKGRWYVFYIEDCCNKYRRFKTEAKARAFANKFSRLHEPYMSSWIDMIVYAPKGVMVSPETGLKKHGGRI